jgi:hypothetical protein
LRKHRIAADQGAVGSWLEVRYDERHGGAADIFDFQTAALFADAASQSRGAMRPSCEEIFAP